MGYWEMEFQTPVLVPAPAQVKEWVLEECGPE
jgi:hypothetical protein